MLDITIHYVQIQYAPWHHSEKGAEIHQGVIFASLPIETEADKCLRLQSHLTWEC